MIAACLSFCCCVHMSRFGACDFDEHRASVLKAMLVSAVQRRFPQGQASQQGVESGGAAGGSLSWAVADANQQSHACFVCIQLEWATPAKANLQLQAWWHANSVVCLCLPLCRSACARVHWQHSVPAGSVQLHEETRAHDHQVDTEQPRAANSAISAALHTISIGCSASGCLKQVRYTTRPAAAAMFSKHVMLQPRRGFNLYVTWSAAQCCALSEQALLNLKANMPES